MWADFQVLMKDASFREEHFCHWEFRSIFPHYRVILILVRKPLGTFWLWSMVLLAYLSDDSLMWDDFQVYIKNAFFREEHFCHWVFRSIFPHYRVILILVRNPLGLFDYDPWSFELIYLTTRWCELIFKYWWKMRLFERNIFVIENFALSFHIIELYWFSWESLWGLFDYDPWSF